MVAIVGPSGSGKSTLLHCLSGLELPSSGAVEIVGTDVGSARASKLAKLRRATIGFVFQQYNLLDSLTALGNVLLQARLAGRPRSDAEAALASVGLADKKHIKPTQLSGGEQQRVAIARALAVKPRILFADEPTGALDSATGSSTLQLLRDLVTAQGSAVVMVTHNLEAAARADRVLILKDGRIRSTLSNPTPQAILDSLAETDNAYSPGGAQ
jgi:putative ABC transport system ATP-binding protein